MDDALFRNGGELGRAMAARDWGSTAVGPPHTWPAALRNMVRIVLTSRFSMWAAWGPELTTFYNDAYWRDTLQAKHPWALGRPAAEMWAEIWDDIGPRIRSVLETGVATWDEDLLLFLERSGYPEETYHTFSYSPLDGADGRVEGMLCVVTETTARVVGERRMATLRDLAAAIAATRTERDVLAAVEGELGRNLADLPFSLTYLIDEDGGARLAAASGIAPGSPAAPRTLEPDDADAVWPLARLREGDQVLVDLDGRVADLPTGAWQRPPHAAVAVPLATSAQEHGPTTGFLVVGLNPHRAFDDPYRGFVDLLAGQITAGLVNAGSYEAERRRAESLAELDRAKTDFFSNVSHEFRTPLTLISGPLAELRNSPAVQADALAREEIEVIERNALRLGKLVNTLLDFSRLQAGRIQARFEPVDLAATTAELASVFRSAVERAGLDFTVDCPPLAQPVYVDLDMWEKVVLNLLSNAVKFTFEGGITVAVRQDGDAAVLTVADTGTGVPPEELPRLFERFHRIERARSRSGEGSGIGLAMVRELVGLHGGTITATSTPDVGTTFTVTLPLGSAHLPSEHVAPVTTRAGVSASAAPYVAEALRWLPGADDQDEQPLLASEPAEVDLPATAPGRVVVADDNADMRDYLKRLLSPRYRVEVVPDGQAALESVLADPPDLVVSDVMMPRLDGMALLARLRADPRTERVPVLLLSARAGQEAAVEGLAAGADDYLVKPFSARELLARVGAHVQLGRVRREAEERFRAMADLVPALIWVSDPDGRRIFLNAGWREYTGSPGGQDVDNDWRARLHPDDEDRYLEVVRAASAAHGPWEIEYRLRRADGAFHWLLERAAPLGAGTEHSGYVGSCTDINARYRESQRQSLLAEVSASLDRAGGIDDQLGTLARVLVSTRLADACDVRRVVDDGRLHRAAVAALDSATEAVLGTMPEETELARAAVETGRTTVSPAHTGAPLIGSRNADPAQLRRRLDANSKMAVPLVVRGRVLAVLALGRRPETPGFTADDRALVEEIAGRAALAVDNALLLADERASAQRLTLLQRATAALSAATTPTSVGATAARHVAELLGPGTSVGVYEVDESLRVLTLLGPDTQGRTDRWHSIPLATVRPLTMAVHERRPQWFEDLEGWLAAHPDCHPELAENMRATHTAGGVALPLAVGGATVGVLGIGFASDRRLTGTERATLLALAEQCAQALDRARLYRAEQRIAETLQRSLLPQGLPQLARLSLVARYLPGAAGTQAGGDWYDVVALDDHRVAIAVGDVVGQGPAAAAVMGQLRSALSTALLAGSSPAEALELLDRFAVRLPAATASTAACLVLDWDAGTIRWARAGHPPPLLLSDGQAEFLDSAGSGTVLGVSGRRPYTEGTATVRPGAVLLLYTDGLVERRNAPIDVGFDRLADAVRQHGGQPPEEFASLVLRDLLADTDQPDDVALIAARLMPPPLEGRLPADPARLAAVRRAVQSWAGVAALPEDAVEDLQLALGEAVANAVEHAYRDLPVGDCVYALSWQPDGGVEVCVEDFGRWRPVPADPGFRGRGLRLIHELAEQVSVHPSPAGGTTVRFRVPVLPPHHEGAAVRRTAAAHGSDVGARLVRDDGGFQLAGELDLSSAETVGPQLLTAVVAAGTTPLDLDLRGLRYLASAGVGLLVEAVECARAVGGRVRLVVDPSGSPARVLALAGLETLVIDAS